MIASAGDDGVIAIGRLWSYLSSCHKWVHFYLCVSTIALLWTMLLILMSFIQNVKC